MVKSLLAMQETQVRSLGWEDPLEKEMATRSSILAWRILWTKEPGGLQSTGLQRVGHSWAANTFIFLITNIHLSNHHNIFESALKGGRSIQIHVNMGRWAVVWQTQIQAAADRALVLTLLLMCDMCGFGHRAVLPWTSPTKWQG